MGDFNIDLLKCETHEDSNAFLNRLSSSFFTPYVLQPTRHTSFFTPYVLQPTRLTSFFTSYVLQPTRLTSFFTPYVLQPTRLTSFFTPYVLQPTRLTSFFAPYVLQPTRLTSFFTLYVLQPTRLTSKSLIDNIYFNSLEYQSYSGNILIEIADHLIQFLILEGFIKERSIPKINLFKRDFSNFNDDEFRKEFNQINWDVIVK